MKRRFLMACTVYGIKTVKQSLQVLELSTPITKPIIKKQYFKLAKKYHPDSSEKQPIKKLNEKELEQKFVNINKAYSYLRDLSEDDINNFRDAQPTKNPANPEKNSQKAKRMSQQQKLRQQTYEYFNKEYIRRRNIEEQQTIDRKNMRMINIVPEFYIGLLLLAVILGDWTYNAYKRSQQKNNNPIETDSRPQYQDVFKSMNMQRKYGTPNQKRESPARLSTAYHAISQ